MGVAECSLSLGCAHNSACEPHRSKVDGGIPQKTTAIHVELRRVRRMQLLRTLEERKPALQQPQRQLQTKACCAVVGPAC